ncbi:Polyisoprenoid-binding protein YceI [Arenibacter palladensis]|uniref:Polyisoprenoid-binding protein YceI n=1 Tax=Arenibacter palladensis TaxID=237373 RepID=A0A1M4XS57_9FLAO|nr:YceI family protein [Arenibacter palladensis]SHE96397.1 Polyisoprenoid-binding protein YceI [Arenibacter palladensis]
MKKFMKVESEGIFFQCKNLIFQVSILLLFLSSNTSNAQVYSTTDGHANFHAKMPLNTYMGKSDQLQGSINFETGKVAFKLSVKSIKTDKDKRDEHMYELLEVEKNPNVLFDGKLMDDFNFDKKGNQTVKVSGDFTLAGTTRQISVPLELVLVSEGTIQLKASWSLLITDYGLERPSIVFIQVNDEHDLSVDAVLKEN